MFKLSIERPAELARMIAHELAVELTKKSVFSVTQSNTGESGSQKLLSVKQAAVYFNCCENTIYNWIKKETYDPNIISVVRNGNRVYLIIKK